MPNYTPTHGARNEWTLHDLEQGTLKRNGYPVKFGSEAAAQAEADKLNK